MSHRRTIAALLTVALALGGPLFGVTTDTVTFTISAINSLSVSGSPTLRVMTATAGSQPDAATDATTSYSVTTNEDGRKITGAIDLPMPSGVTLSIRLAAPAGGASAGDVALAVAPADLVTSITRVAEVARPISYSMSATVQAGVVAPFSRTVTLTVQ